MNLRAAYAATANRCAMFEHRTCIGEASSLVQRALHPVRYLLQSAFDISLAPRALEIFLAVRGVILVEIAFPVHEFKWHALLS